MTDVGQNQHRYPRNYMSFMKIVAVKVMLYLLPGVNTVLAHFLGVSTDGDKIRYRWCPQKSERARHNLLEGYTIYDDIFIKLQLG